MFVTSLVDTPLDGGRIRQVKEPLRWRDGKREVEIPVGFFTDYHSTPRLAWTALPPHWYPEAAVGHDYLYAAGQGSREQADALYNDMLAFCINRYAGLRGMSRFETWRQHQRRHIQYYGVRVGGWVAWDRWRRLRETDTIAWSIKSGLGVC